MEPYQNKFAGIIFIIKLFVEMNLTMSQRRMINLFKTFIEKIFVPYLPKMDASAQKQWNSFSKMLTSQSFNYGEVQLYVDTLSMPNQGIIPNVFDRNRNKSPLNIGLTKKDSFGGENINSTGFNPSKTFGGERARIALQMNMEEDSRAFGGNFKQSKQTSFKEEKTQISTLSLQPSLEKMFKLFNDNQTKIDKMSTMWQNGIKMYT